MTHLPVLPSGFFSPIARRPLCWLLNDLHWLSMHCVQLLQILYAGCTEDEYLLIMLQVATNPIT